MAKTTNPSHEHPHTAVPLRISKESGFAGPGMDTPAERQRPARDVGTPQLHPLNKAIRDEDKSLIGPELGRGGTAKPTQAPKTPLPGDEDRGFQIPGVDEGFQDVTALIGKSRGS